MVRLSDGLPRIDVVVPAYNECRLIDWKLRTLAALRHPGHVVRFWIVDGGSDDGTADCVDAWVTADPRFSLLRTGAPGKTAQLNAAIVRCTADWILVTDVDTLVGQRAFDEMLAAADKPDVAVVGAPVVPRRAHVLEELHWRLTNRLRAYERRRQAALSVAGPAYMFRRRLIRQLPPDVVADDIFVALAAAAAGERAEMIATHVVETRSPLTLGGLFRHKRRKAAAYLREMFRFLPSTPRMEHPTRTLFLVRVALITIAPVTLVTGASWLTVQAPLAVGSLALAGLIASLSCRASFALRFVWLGGLLMLAAFAALVGYPFRRQTSCLTKVATLESARTRTIR